MAASRVLVTGGAGFIGSHLVERLAQQHQVLVVDNLSTGRADALPPTARLEVLDVTSGRLATIARRWRPSLIVHLAAQVSVAASVRDPEFDLRVNIVGTARVAAASREVAAHRLVFVSSGGAVYGETVRPATERSLPAPASPYGIHKLAAEGHARLSGVPTQVVRPSNVYGPGQRVGLEGGAIAAFIARARRGEALEIHGDGRQSRDWLHVADLVEALVTLAHPASPPGTWNVASERRLSVRAIAQLVEIASGRRLGRTWTPVRKGDIRHSAISAARMRQLNWQPRVPLETAIAALLSVDELVAGPSR